MANTIITPSMIAKEALFKLTNNMVMGRKVHRAYVNEFKKIGDTVTIRKPVKFRAKDGATLDQVDVLEQSHTLTVSSRKHVGWNFSSAELTLSIEQYSQRYIQPACLALANKIDLDLCLLYKDVYNYAGTAGSVPDSFADLALASQVLDENACPNDMRNAILNPAAYWKMAGAQTALLQQALVNDAFKRGDVGMIAGFDLAMDQNIAAHTVGAHGGTPLMNGATAEGATELVTDGWTASAAILKEGDVFTVAGVYAVNPVSGQSTGALRTFVATSDVTADGSGNATIPIAPAIYSAAASETYLPYQTVTALPADGAAITVKGTASTAYAQNMCFHKNAFVLVTVPLALPDSAGFKARETYDGVSIRVVKDYDITNDKEIIRLDVMYGVDTIYPDLAARLTN